MTHSLSDHPRLWSIILAGNEPSTLDPFVKLWQGSYTPKHFCTFAGTRSLLQHTWDLADQFSHPENRVTVVTHPFIQQTCRQFGGRVPGLIATEPFQKGSLPSALLGLATVHAQDPHSTVALYPSRSFIHPESQFLRTIQRAVWVTKILKDRMVLLGAHSDFAVGKYGWLGTKEQLGWASGLPVMAIEMSPTAMFPTRTTNPSSIFPSSSTFLNSGIVLTTTEVLWNLCEVLFPGIHDHLEILGSLTGQPEKQLQKTLAFQHLPSGCFWIDCLSKMTEHLAMVELQDVSWSDWEDPGHIADTLSLIGREPVFPVQWPHSHEGRCAASHRDEAKPLKHGPENIHN